MSALSTGAGRSCDRECAESALPACRIAVRQSLALKWLEADRGAYDVVFCDPPTFSNSKRADDFDVQRDHVRLLRAGVARLAEGGVLYFSNNFRRFRLDETAISEFATVEDIKSLHRGPLVSSICPGD